MRDTVRREPLRRIRSEVRRRLAPDDLVQARGHWFYNDPTDTLGIGQGLEWEPFETAVVKHLVAPGDTVIDVGAHIGYYTLLMAQGVGRSGRVIAFEPDADNRSLLERNVRLNGYRNVTIEASAVGAGPGTATLYRSFENRGDNRIVDPGEVRQTVSVACTSLDDYVESHRLTVDAIKMDIQGAEAYALDGMERLFVSSPRLVLTCEFWPFGLARAGVDPAGFLARLHKLGLDVIHMDGDDHRLERADATDLLGRYPVAEFGRHTNLLCSKDVGRLRQLEESLRAAPTQVTPPSIDADGPSSEETTGSGSAESRRSVRSWFSDKLRYRLLRGLRDLFVAFVGRYPGFVDRMERVVYRLFPEEAHPFPSGVLRSLLKRVQPLFLDYPVNAKPRWGYDGQPPHPQLSQLLEERTPAIAELLQSFHVYTEQLARIPSGAEYAGPEDPTWINDWFGGMDGVALYGIIATRHPHTYMEVGSGVSTKFARRAIRDNGLATRIVSIDPTPRSEIDALCDVQIREPLENVDLSVFEQLRAGDIIFLDGSHRVFMNSDVVVFLLDVLPRLPEGVYVHLHDIFLPYDYLPDWAGRYYSEQYMLASFLLGGGRGVEVILPCTFVTFHPELLSLLIPIWAHPGMEGVAPHGASFWMRTTAT